jgi:site-specific recombinase XerD
MIEDMTVRGFTASTQRGYLAAASNFTTFLGRAPDQAEAVDLRRYQLKMRSAGASATTMNAAVSALRSKACRISAAVHFLISVAETP